MACKFLMEGKYSNLCSADSTKMYVLSKAMLDKYCRGAKCRKCPMYIKAAKKKGAAHEGKKKK